MSLESAGEAAMGALRVGRRRTPVQDRVAELFEELRDDVYHYLLTLGLNPPQAQEAAQEVFLRLYVTLRRNETVENPRAWIFRVAHNYGLKVRAREKALLPFDPDLEARLAASDLSPESTALERDRMVRLHRAVENLSEQQRRCLFLRMQGLRYPEIGEALGISPSTVGEFMRRAIARLRRLSGE